MVVAFGEWLVVFITIFTGIMIGFGIYTGFWLSGRLNRQQRAAEEEEARHLITEAQHEAAHIIKTAQLEAKEEIYNRRLEQDREMEERQRDLKDQLDKARELERRHKLDLERLGDRETELGEEQERLTARRRQLDAEREQIRDSQHRLRRELEQISAMTSEEARKSLLSELEHELRHESAHLIRQIEAETRDQANRKARKLVTLAAQKCAAEVVGEVTVSVLPLQSDDMKGRIIGREGRNIRSLEALTGVNIIVDDTPGAVVLSCYDPLRREIARQTLERLLGDGRIHPARIEDTFARVEEEMNEHVVELGSDACFELGIHDADRELHRLLGRLHYRTSYGQNILAHSKEIARLMATMAAELGVDISDAKRAGLLHDIGKAVTAEVEGPHALVGADICRTAGEPPAVVHAVAAHHNDEEPRTVIAVLLQAADAISAARPGARRESLERYIKKLSHLEELAETFNGVTKAFALQAGREIRVMVEPSVLNDDDCIRLARDISKQIETELQFPGRIQVTVLRETRVTDYAN